LAEARVESAVDADERDLRLGRFRLLRAGAPSALRRPRLPGRDARDDILDRRDDHLIIGQIEARLDLPSKLAMKVHETARCCGDGRPVSRSPVIAGSLGRRAAGTSCAREDDREPLELEAAPDRLGQQTDRLQDEPGGLAALRRRRKTPTETPFVSRLSLPLTGATFRALSSESKRFARLTAIGSVNVRNVEPRAAAAQSSARR
jgi:hypothetical protein